MTHADLMNAPVNGAFEKWPKMPRLFKDCTVSEKIDGTNACVLITPVGADHVIAMVETPDGPRYVSAQSRTRMITPESDNYGFARWVEVNADLLVEALGMGRHYGEWWGRGIQRGYDREGRTFSLFNTGVYGDARELFESQSNGELSVVPELYVGPFDSFMITDAMMDLEIMGSVAAPGFMDPEGVAVFHHASRTVFKATYEYDGHKGGPRDQDDNVIQMFRPEVANADLDQLLAA